MNLPKRVVIGLLGTSLDGPCGSHRWELWRPTVSLFQHEDLLIDRLELLHPRNATRLAEVVEKDIHHLSPETEIRRHLLEMADPWDFEEVYSTLLDFTDSYAFNTEQEEYLIHITTGTHVAQICLFLLNESHYLPGKLLQCAPPPRKKKGHDPGTYRIIDLDLSRYDRIAQRFHRQQRAGLSYLKFGIETRNAAFNRMIEEIEHVAIQSRDPILLLGPTGAGKSRLARRIFELKKQRHLLKGGFVEVNCATIRGDAAMSALFGHKKGAFTGAVADRSGLLCAADGGLLFLDEVGELGADEQAMLLHAIEDKTFLPLGTDVEGRSDFQLICGSNRDLVADAGDQRFREDLLARINLWTYVLPALVQRKEDIEPNVAYELSELAARTGSIIQFNTEARARFLAFAESSEARWTGNFRDLNAAIRRMGTMAQGGRITLAVVEQEIQRLQQGWRQPFAEGREEHLLKTILGEERLKDLDLFDRVQLGQVLRICRQADSLSEAGRTLFQASRRERKITNDADRLRKYLLRFGLAWDLIHSKDDAQNGGSL